MGSANEHIREALSIARDSSQSLVPIIGAGVSQGLGLPSWGELVEKLLPDCDRAGEQDSADHPSILLDRARNELGEVQFSLQLQRLLSLPTQITSLTLQALVAARPRRIITTNLDEAVENAFICAGSPLRYDAIGRGSEPGELAKYESTQQSVALLKIHGSIERPHSWVLTRRQYDAAYLEPGLLKRFFENQVSCPLFIGFSFSDTDLAYGLRLRSIRWQRHAFALLPQDLAVERAGELRSLGVLTIPFFSFAQIPEILDEIFECGPLMPRMSGVLGGDVVNLEIGGAGVLVDREELEALEKSGLASRSDLYAIANAVEPQPDASFLSKKSRRRYGAKGYYRELVHEMIVKEKSAEFCAVVGSISSYPDVLFEGLISSLVRTTGLSDDQTFWWMSRFYAQMQQASPFSGAQATAFFLDVIDGNERFPVRRTAARVLALAGAHPALEFPPPVLRVVGLWVPRYPLTEGQVARLRGQLESKAVHSIRPCIVRSLSEAADIIRTLRSATGKPWRLPTQAEWMRIACLADDEPWPWGEEPPAYRVHAHLKYLNMSGQLPKHAVEVGLFPQGASTAGVMDLIGNVHELVVRDGVPGALAQTARSESFDHYLLAGGGWTTRFSPEAKFPLFSRLSRPRDNTGIRPIYESA